MKKPLLGLLLGAVLGAFDGLTAMFSAPERGEVTMRRQVDAMLHIISKPVIATHIRQQTFCSLAALVSSSREMGMVSGAS